MRNKFVFTYELAVVLLTATLLFPPAYALEATGGGFGVRQETYKLDGCLVSRPVPLEKRLMDWTFLNGIRSVETYEKWLKKNIEYLEDEGRDVWASPEETLAKRGGDCEDFAFLNAAVLGALGYDASVIAFGVGQMERHAICLFVKDGCFFWFDNDALYESPFTSIAEVAEYIFETHDSRYILELNLASRSRAILARKQL